MGSFRLPGLVSFCGGMLVAFMVFAPVSSKAQDAGSGSLVDLSIEALMDLEVTSVSKKATKFSESAAAIAVITNDDIRRSGATTIPDALRLVPGMQVSSLDANKWAVSARGLPDRFAAHLLVLVDGRSVYTPTFSGVYWDVQDLILEDIDRIEVIRGPGATLWGSNAVNGVINIVTKQASDTQGILSSLTSGSQEIGTGVLRYGGEVGNASYRIHGKYFKRDDYRRGSHSADDEWDLARGGFRVDIDAADDTQLTIQGDVYGGDSGETFYAFDRISGPNMGDIPTVDNSDVSGGNVLARVTHRVSDTQDLSFQLYYDQMIREESMMDMQVDTIDLDFQHRFQPFSGNELVWGAGFRWIEDEFDFRYVPGVTPGAFLPISRGYVEDEGRDYAIYSAFLQDEATLVEDQLVLTFGSKVEYNDFTGFEYQPSGRLAYTPNEDHTIWAAVSRAVRTPSRIEGNNTDIFAATACVDGSLSPPAPVPIGPFGCWATNPGNTAPVVASIQGNKQYESEIMIGYELGYRAQPVENFSYDLALYYNDYDHVRGFHFGPMLTNAGNPVFATTPGPNPDYFIAPIVLNNRVKMQIWGGELALNWQPYEWWRMHASYTYTHINIQLGHGGEMATLPGASATSRDGETPRHAAHFRTSFDLPGNVEFDTLVWYQTKLAAVDVEKYLRVDVRLAWRPTDNLEIALVGQNLTTTDHTEFFQSGNFIQNSEVPRAYYGKITFQY